MEELGEAGPCGRLVYATAQAIARRQAVAGAKGLGEEEVATLSIVAEEEVALTQDGPWLYSLFL